MKLTFPAIQRLLWVLTVLAVASAGPVPKNSAELSPLDRYIQEAIRQPSAARNGGASPGSLWSPVSSLSDLAGDLRAAHVDDMITIVISERASGSATGDTSSSRKSSASAGLSSLYGPLKANFGQLLGSTGEQQLQGQGSTSRETTMTATLAARVTHVLPNGYLVIEGVKDTMVNSERQIVSVRGVVRAADISAGNLVRSERVAQLEVRINGKGVVGDAIRRPNFLYRLLLGVLPF